MDIPQDLTDIDFKAYRFNDNHTKVWDFDPMSFGIAKIDPLKVGELLSIL